MACAVTERAFGPHHHAAAITTGEVSAAVTGAGRAGGNESLRGPDSRLRSSADRAKEGTDTRACRQAGRHHVPDEGKPGELNPQADGASGGAFLPFPTRIDFSVPRTLIISNICLLLSLTLPRSAW